MRVGHDLKHKSITNGKPCFISFDMDVRFDSYLILSYLLAYIIFHVINGFSMVTHAGLCPKPLSHCTAIPRRWHGDLKIRRASWDRMEILENKANNFTFSITWRCHGVPTATVAFLRSAHDVLPRSHGVLGGDWLCGHEAFMACSWRAKSCHRASTACSKRARCVQCVSTAPARSVYEHFRKIHQAYCRNIIETGIYSI